MTEAYDFALIDQRVQARKEERQRQEVLTVASVLAQFEKFMCENKEAEK